MGLRYQLYNFPQWKGIYKTGPTSIPLPGWQTLPLRNQLDSAIIGSILSLQGKTPRRRRIFGTTLKPFSTLCLEVASIMYAVQGLQTI